MTASLINSNFSSDGPDGLFSAIRSRAKLPNLQNVRTVDSTESQDIIDSTVNSQQEGPGVSGFPTSRGTGTSSQIIEIGDDLDNINSSGSASPHQVAPGEIDLNASYPGEMIDDGMEWLQSLFANGLDANLLPVWD